MKPRPPVIRMRLLERLFMRPGDDSTSLHESSLRSYMSIS
jgi:hypothetical protein